MLCRATTAKFYPYRHLVERWINKGIQPVLFEQLKHPGYTNFSSSRTIGQGYAEFTNKYTACLVDGLVFNYTVAKIFEIPASGCLLLINDEMRVMMQELGFEPFTHFVPYNRTSLRSVAEYVLDPGNLPHVNRMRRNAQELVRTRHQLHHRVALIHAAVTVLRTNPAAAYRAWEPQPSSAVQLVNCLARVDYSHRDCRSKDSRCCHSMSW